MHLERYGSGSRLFFGLHGWSGDHRTFAPLREYLPDDCSLYSADLPGCGLSPSPAVWALPAITNEIVEAVSSVASPALTLIGNCSGALLGLLAAKQLASRFERLVLIDPFAYWPWYFRVFVEPSFGRYAYYSTFANPVGRWLANRSLKSKRAGEAHLTQSFSEVNHETVYRYLLLLTGIDGVEQFRELQMPIDIVYGGRTFGAVKESCEIWRAIWPQVRIHELDGAGHLPIEEATKQLSEIIFRLVSEPEPASAQSAIRGAARQ